MELSEAGSGRKLKDTKFKETPEHPSTMGSPDYDSDGIVDEVNNEREPLFGTSTLPNSDRISSWASRLMKLRRRDAATVVVTVVICVCFFTVKIQAPGLDMPDRAYGKPHQDMWDFEGPPVPLNGSVTLLSLMNQSRAVQAVTAKGPKKSRRHKSKHSYPIIHDTENALPAPGTLYAAEALLCRKSVINFVINATDAKDECEGLKKAFDKTCSNEEAGGDRNRRRRTLWEKAQHHKRIQLFVYKHIRWFKLWTRKILGPPAFFFSEDEVVEVYDDAQCLVRNDLDPWFRTDLQRKWRHDHVLRRQLEQEDQGETLSEEDTNMKIDEDEEEEGEQAAEQTVALQPMKSLDLPTANEHVTDKMLSETLLLHQGDKLIEKAQDANEKNEAMIDAKASSKTMADTNAAVSALLNDPTSIEVRTCCTSILNVYHENCSTDDDEQVSDSKLFFVVFVMAMCGVVKSVIRHYKIVCLPEAAGCIIVGVLSGFVLHLFPHHDISFDGNWFLRILVPPIVFEAALNIDKRSFNRHVVPILIYAILGTLLSTGVTAYIVHWGTTMLRGLCAPIPYAEALTFGALISSIDPIAVLSVLSNMGMTDTDTIYVVIFGESLLNDGVAIVLFHTLVHFLDENLVIDSQAVSAASAHFFVVAFGSLLIGIGSGVLSTVYFWQFHGCQTPLVEVLMFFCWALLPYYVCDGIGWSGIVSAVATGFMMDLYIVGDAKEDAPLTDDSEDTTSSRNGEGKRVTDVQSHGRRSIFSSSGHLSDEARQHIGFVASLIATTMEIAIFAYLGLFLFSYRYHWNLAHVFIAIIACCVSRGIMIPTLSFVANWITRIQQYRACRVNARRGSAGTPINPAGVIIDQRMQLVLWFAGLRGAMSFALVEHIPLYDSVSGEGSRLKPELKAMTSASIMFTVFLLGGYTYYVMDYLGLSPTGSVARKASSHTFEMTSLIGKTDSGDEFEVANTPESKQESNMFGRRVKTAFRRQRYSADQNGSDDHSFQ